MMVANSFDLWQKDAFFSAAEEVQESADILESAYRMWLKEKRDDGVTPKVFDELCRELQIALGTAKWQLDEFERAVRLSYGNRGDDLTSARHRDFVYAIDSLISRVEAELREVLSERGSQPFRWINLDKEENDDLAMFLSSTCQFLQTANNGHVNSESSPLEFQRGKTDDLNGAYGINIPEETNALENVNTGSGTDSCHIIDIDTKNSPGSRDDIVCQIDSGTSAKRMWSSPKNFGALRIVVSSEDEPVGNLSTIEATPKDKGSKPFFWRQRCGEYFQAREAINLYNKIAGRFDAYKRQMQGPLPMQFNCSLRLTLALMLSILFIVPFLLYSS